MSEHDQASSTTDRSTPLVRAGLLVIVGLLIQALTLLWSHPTAFLFFAGFGVSLVALGIVLYLWTILRTAPA